MGRYILPRLEAPDPALEERIRRRLEEVEAALHRSVASDIELVAAASRHLIAAGGKRFRPMLVILGAGFGDPDAAEVVPGAVAIELTHLASLYHDDVIDEADNRRGVPSVNAEWGNTVAVLTGDYLFARSSEISAELGTEVSRLLAATIARVCEGQILEAQITGRVDVTETEYVEVIRRKTAALIATSCRLGGMLGGAGPVEIESLARYGQSLGMAFQLSDDIMDVTADEETLGKEPGVDLREGVYTLPVIHALRDSEELRELLAQGRLEGERLQRALDLTRSEAALDRARDWVTREVRRAAGEIESLPEGPPKEALLHLARFLAARCGVEP